MKNRVLRNCLNALLITVIFICSAVGANEPEYPDGSGVFFTSRVYHGRLGVFNPSWQRNGSNPFEMMNQLCKSVVGDDFTALALGSPNPGNTTIGFCGVAPDNIVYRCDSNNDPSDQETEMCATYAEINCDGSHSSFRCAAANPKELGCNANSIGNPCNAATGNKSLSLHIFKTGSLSLDLTYNSQDYSLNHFFGRRWSSNFDKEIYFDTYNVQLIDDKGKADIWQYENNQWVGEADSDNKLVQTTNGFIVTYSNGHETYFEQYKSSDSRLVSKEIDPNGNQISYDYQFYAGRIVGVIVSDEYGASIRINQNSVVDGDGNSYHFNLNPANNALNWIRYPDLTPGSASDNPTKYFLYEVQDRPFLLTGIIDENGNRYATYTYDSGGKAISTEHSQTTNTEGQERFELNYLGENN